MEFGLDVLTKILKRERESTIEYEKLKELFNLECYRILNEIKEILENDVIEDAECFWRIEEIVSVFEKAGTSCGGRHDF